MSTKTEDDPQPVPAEADTPELKPPGPRRKRTAAIEAPAEVASAAAELVPGAAAEPVAEAPVAPAAVHVDERSAVALAADAPAGTAQEGDEAAADAPPGAEQGAEGGPEGGPRSRRRNRRDRRERRERAEAAAGSAGPAVAGASDVASAGVGDDDDEPEAPPVPIPSLPPSDPADRFAEAVSGAYDTAFEPAPEEAPPKRVLAAEPEAPKLHKVLAQAGVGSRREMEEMIADGRISVNGQPAHTGQRISFGDHIKVDGKPVRVRIVPPPPRIVAYHKPAGEIVTHDDPQNRPTVFRRLPRLQRGKWQSVGRLDINTEGLLLFTNSGELANQLMHPRFGVEREYAVRVLGTLDPDDRADLLEGVSVDGQEASFESIEDGGGDGANRWYRVVITEGRNREVRKLFDAVDLVVNRLIRIRYGSVVLPLGLKRGHWVDLGDDDVRAIRRLAQPQGGQQGPRDDRGPRGDKRGNKSQQQQRGRGDRNRGPRPDGGPPMHEQR